MAWQPELFNVPDHYKNTSTTLDALKGIAYLGLGGKVNIVLGTDPVSRMLEVTQLDHIKDQYVPTGYT